MKNKYKEADPYSALHDTHNIIKEYYNLKQQLCLTAEERERLGISEWSDYVRYKPNQ